MIETTAEERSDLHLATVLRQLRRLPECGGIERVSVALYDHTTNRLRASAAATVGVEPLPHYEIDFDEVPSLAILATGSDPRVIDDMATYGRDSSPHTMALRAAGYRSSLTAPIHADGQFVGFVFFNALVKRYFTPSVVGRLAPHAPTILRLVQRSGSTPTASRAGTAAGTA